MRLLFPNDSYLREFIYFRIHAIASVPIVDCYQKILQQIKCYLKLSAGTDSTELRKGLDVIDQTNLKYFNPEMISDFYALKGKLLSFTTDLIYMTSRIVIGIFNSVVVVNCLT